MREQIFQHFLKSRSISTDSRNILTGSVFFALKGEKFNGNLFAKQALEKGASMAVVDEKVDGNDPQIILVENVLSTLQELALDYRRTFQIPFLAITGSNGKTTSKELVRDVIAKSYKVHATKGNLNNHIGIPLTILSIPKDCEFAIIEMGANHQKEIASYCLFTEPNFGLITNMGKAHLEGFGGEDGVVKGKKELFDYLMSHHGKAFVNIDLPKLKEAAAKNETITYGFDLPNFKLKLLSESPVVSYEFIRHNKTTKTTTNLVGAYNLYNIASAIAVGQYFDVAEMDIHEAISNYKPENNRSQLLNTVNNSVIMDSYNANPSSMGHALLSLSNQQAGIPFFILGDMRELGDVSLVEHKKTLELAQELKLDGLVIGPHFSAVASDFNYKSFIDLDTAKIHLQRNPIKGKMILLKGSRGMHLEDLVSSL